MIAADAVPERDTTPYRSELDALITAPVGREAQALTLLDQLLKNGG